jgi:uncharacterized protein (DUF1800 family)
MNHHQRYLGLAACALALAACTGEGRAGSTPEGQDEGDSTAEIGQPVLTPIDTDGLRFLEQATFGATPGSLADFETLGSTPTDRMNAWIAAQIAAPASRFVSAVVTPGTHPLRDQFFNNAINGQDQLRQRVAFALSQIFVTSLIKLKDDSWMVPYANLLVDGAFGNLEDLLVAIAESPAMGHYLDNANNFVVDVHGNPIAPNENFARELMQLFTVGLCDLKPNGALQGGECKAPYSQVDVENYAHLMSGWTFDTHGSGGGACPTQLGRRRPVNLGTGDLPMQSCNSLDHDYAQWPLLNAFDQAHVYQNGAGSPTSGWSTRDTMEKPLDTVAHTSGVIADLFNHPNVGPFIGKQLIQHLVTSNPSGAYVGRISAVFADDGTPAHARGNLAAVVKAILTDVEARDASPNARYGHLREPALYITSVMRLVASTADGAGIRRYSADMGQDIFFSPSVFNYYPASYPVPTPLLPPGSGQVVAGEFGIEDTNTILARANFVDTLLYTPNAIGSTTALSISGLPSDAALMIQWCNAYMMHNTMTAAMSSTLTTALSSVTGNAMKKRALYLVATSSQFQIER